MPTLRAHFITSGPDKGDYDVARIVRDLQTAYFSPPGNKATGENMRLLLKSFDDLTQHIKTRIAWLPGAAQTPESIRNDYTKWRARLDAYVDIADEAPEGHSETLAEYVVRPLFFGIWPGEEIRRRSDMSTPFILANNMKTSREWKTENFDRFVEDLKEGAKKTGGSLAWLAAVAGFVLAVIFLRR